MRRTARQSLTALSRMALTLWLLSSGTGLAFQQEMKTAATKISEALEKRGRKSAAVVDFTDLQGDVTELGRFLAEQLSVALASEDRSFEVIDRGHLRTLLKEHKLNASGAIDPQTAKRVGQIAGVDCLITGSITPLGDVVSLTVKALDTQTASTIRAIPIDIPKTKAIEELLGRGIGAPGGQPPRESESAPTTGKPAATARVSNSKDANGFTFELTACRKTGTSLACDLVISNHEKERKIWLVANTWNFKSEIVDDSGKTTSAERVSDGERSDIYLTKLLYPEVPTRVTLSFRGLEESAEALRLLVFGAGVYDESQNLEKFRVTFRDIEIGARMPASPPGRRSR